MTRIHAVLLVLCLTAAAPALAGCVGSASAGWDNVRASAGAAPDEIPARSALDEAEREAGAWRPDARLAGVAAVESERPMDGAHAFGADPRVANGRAPAWAFEYVAANATLRFVVRADRSVVDREQDAGDAQAETVGAWSVDSDEAVEALLTEPRFADAAARATWAVDALGRENGTTVWVVTVLDDAMAGAAGIVDATTGDVLEVAEWDTAPGWAAFGEAWAAAFAGNVTHEETYRGDLTPLAPDAAYEFPVEAKGQAIRVDARAFPHASLGLEFVVLDALGREVAMREGVATGAPYSAFDEHALHGAATVPGTYTLVVRMPAPGAYARYEATVTVGEPSPFEALADVPSPVPRALADLPGV